MGATFHRARSTMMQHMPPRKRFLRLELRLSFPDLVAGLLDRPALLVVRVELLLVPLLDYL